MDQFAEVKPASADEARMRRLVRQAAETSRLLGVDFVPSYSLRGGVVEQTPRAEVASSEPAAEPTTAAPAPGSRFSPRAIPEPKTDEASSAPAAPAHRARSRETNQQRLDDLRKRYEQDAPHKSFVTAFTNIVFGEGDPCARLMFVGEAPGADEDRTGRPFVGRAGQLLDKMIVAMGLRREDVYIANVLKTRPPNNATPTLDECLRCAPYLLEQIAIVSPEAIVTLGLPASRTLLNSEESMSRLRGRWSQVRIPPIAHMPDAPATVPVMPTYHPAFLLRSYTRENREKVWSDLTQVVDRLGLRPAGPQGDAIGTTSGTTE